MRSYSPTPELFAYANPSSRSLKASKRSRIALRPQARRWWCPRLWRGQCLVPRRLRRGPRHRPTETSAHTSTRYLGVRLAHSLTALALDDVSENLAAVTAAGAALSWARWETDALPLPPSPVQRRVLAPPGLRRSRPGRAHVYHQRRTSVLRRLRTCPRYGRMKLRAATWRGARADAGWPSVL
jgi:hypothetical protein